MSNNAKKYMLHDCSKVEEGLVIDVAGLMSAFEDSVRNEGGNCWKSKVDVNKRYECSNPLPPMSDSVSYSPSEFGNYLVHPVSSSLAGFGILDYSNYGGWV